MEYKSLRYEIGPIRPPNEAYSLLVRFTRNCTWNRCEFCHTYKGRAFQKRSLQEIIRDIDTIKQIETEILELSARHGGQGRITDSLIETIFATPTYNECFKSVAVWMYFGGKNVFIQDANSLAMSPPTLIEALTYLKEQFPSIERITSYARARTIAKRLSVENLTGIRKAGLTRLHLGLESGSDYILYYIQKGLTREDQIEAGRKVKEAGIELSEYVVLGLGGRAMWREHALETAEALNRINPDFIRFRTLKVLKTMALYSKLTSGDFLMESDKEILAEERLLIENLDGITSTIKSDHILNLLEDIAGTMPEDKEKMLATIDTFLALPPEEQLIYRFGRRSGIYRSLNDLRDELTHQRIKKAIREIEDKEPGGAEKAIAILLENYI